MGSLDGGQFGGVILPIVLDGITLIGLSCGSVFRKLLNHPVSL